MINQKIEFLVRINKLVVANKTISKRILTINPAQSAVSAF